VSDVDVGRQLERRGLAATALSMCFGGTTSRNGLLLGFGGAVERTLDRATRTLGDVL
jgi:hypothetical protein